MPLYILVPLGTYKCDADRKVRVIGMISWYYWDYARKRQQKHIVRSYPNSLESIRFRLPNRLQDSEEASPCEH
jgi:hypothetical protein